MNTHPRPASGSLSPPTEKSRRDMRRAGKHLVIGLTLLMASACGGTDTAADEDAQMGHASDEDAQMGHDPEGFEAEGPASEPLEYADGLIVRPAVDEPPKDWAADFPSGHTLVRVTLTLENTGEDAVDLSGPFQKMALMHGPNRQDADRVSGYMGEHGEDLNSDDPRQVGAGQTVEVAYSYAVPDEDSDELLVEATIDDYPPYIFTGVEELL